MDHRKSAMGEVIDLQQRRPKGRKDPPAAVPAAMAWPLPPGYAALVMLDRSFSLWRSLVAGYAGLWFAPLGIEVRVTEKPPQRPSKARVTSGG